MGPVTFAVAGDFSLEDVTLAFNIGFTGYYLPMRQTSASLAEMMQKNDVRLSASVMTLVEGELAGVGLVGIRGVRAWIAGMGIAPQWRRHGLGRRLLGELLAAARREGARVAQLEALSVNEPALALYRSMGFRDRRELRVFQGPLSLSASTTAAVNGTVKTRLAPVAMRTALAGFEAFHQIEPAWQREAQTLSRMRGVASGLGLWQSRSLLAYAIYRHQPGGFVIFDAGSRDARSEARLAQLVELLRWLAGEHPETVARAINVPEDDSLGFALDSMGCAVVARQREMTRRLDSRLPVCAEAGEVAP